MCNERKWPLFCQFRFLHFLTNFFFRQVKNHTQPELETPNFGGYVMLAEASITAPTVENIVNSVSLKTEIYTIKNI